MEREHRRHYRVAMRQIEETPKEGMYVTRAEAMRYAAFSGAVTAVLFFLLLFRGKR